MSQKHSDAAVMLLKLDAALPTAEIPPPPPPHPTPFLFFSPTPLSAEETERFHMGKPGASQISLTVGMKYTVCTYHHIIRPKGIPAMD